MNNWVYLSIASGTLFGFGVVCVNNASRNSVPLAVSIMSLAVVWLCLSAFTVNMETFKNVSLRHWIFLGIAGGLFFIGNFTQFSAMVRAPLTGYVIILIASVNVLVTACFDIMRKLQEGTLVFSLYEIAGVLFGFATITCFALATRN